MVQLGFCYAHEESSAKGELAVSWFRKAADLGDIGGMVQLGFAYREGRGVPENFGESVRWFIKAADAGDRHSLLHAGRVFSWYLKSPRDAVPWLLRSAEAGLIESFLELALIFDDRKSEIYDPVEAAKWYQLVIERHRSNAPRALLALFCHYRAGVGVPCSAERAMDYLRQIMEITHARSQLHKMATKLLREMNEELL